MNKDYYVRTNNLIFGGLLAISLIILQGFISLETLTFP
jgi:hypothetical protein